MTRPITDAFGTRLEADALAAGLAQAGLDTAHLLLTDDGLVLECADPSDARDDVASAVTWLRSRFSPLVPLRVAPQTTTEGPRIADQRRRPLDVIALVEVTNPETGLAPAIAELLRRTGPEHAAGAILAARVEDPPRADLVARIAAELQSRSVGASIAVLAPSPAGMQVVGESASSALHLLAWFRPGSERGVRPGALIAASRSGSALQWLGRALRGEDVPVGGHAPQILIDGLAWRLSRRPTVAALRSPTSDSPIVIDPDRCTHCGLCAQMCPEDYLGADGRPKTSDATACTRCYDCIEACPTDAIRPVEGADTALLASSLAHRPGWLSRLAGLPGPSVPAPFPPSYLLPKEKPATKPTYVLGLAVATMQEHAAVLLKDGELVGAIEHEKLVRVRHAGWHPPGRAGVTIAVDPTITLEEALCRRPIRTLLAQEGLTLDDVDAFAVNGLHGRYAHRISFTDASVALPKMRTGRVHYQPHHLTHAASAWRASGAPSAWVLTVDGRGDRECAALWRGENGELRLVDTLLALTDRSIGGVYEGITRLLGFGSHGQGSVMALASFGTPRFDLRRFLSFGDDGKLHVHESGIDAAFASLRRTPADPLTQDHKDLAASLQAALEEAVVAFVRRNVGDGPLDALCLAGGVSLNCRMNERLRRTFRPGSIFAQPGANDAGTAFGAAFEAWHDLGGPPRTTPLADAYLGPGFTNEEIERVLQRSGLVYARAADVAAETAARLANGEVACWFQGRLEFGPRALGGRSIVADPRRPEIHGRVNGLKERESWRPFGPSILAGHEGEWLDGAFDARFMLFTMPILEAQRAKVPAVVHVDGTTRPQVVHADAAPRYHALISAFHGLTGVPMVLNTSFNRRGEPIVCTPEDAVDSFLGLGADFLAIGDFLVERTRATAPTAAGSARDPSEVVLVGTDEAMHDALSGAPGTFKPLVMNVRSRVQAGVPVRATIRLMQGNLRQVGGLVGMAQKLGLKQVRVEIAAPIELTDRVLTDQSPRLSIASLYVRQAIATGQRVGVAVTTKGLPLCQLPPELRAAAAAPDAALRVDPPPCRGCSVRARCERPSSLYLELFGSSELTPL